MEIEPTIASWSGEGRKMYRFGGGGGGNINIAGGEGDCTLAFLSIGKSRARRSSRAQEEGRRKKGCPDV